MFVVRDHTAELDGQPVFWRDSRPDPPATPTSPPAATPTLFVHGSPTSSDDWLPFLSRIPGIAPDLPGFGRSGKRGDGDFTMAGYDRFLERWLDSIEVDRVNLVVHDWGGAALLWAQRFPERVERLVVINAVPVGQRYRWHWIARMWRRPVLGELFMGSSYRWTVRQLLKPATALEGDASKAMRTELADQIVTHLDQGTQRAILRLYRDASPDALLAAGAHLDEITAPALVVWGQRDPYIGPEHGARFAELLPNATLRPIERAGHWVWLDEPDVVEQVVDFLGGDASA
jgi:pimeloyl-ACP methyl ester carboxylesterase